MFIRERKIWMLLLAGVMILSLCACGSNQTGNTENTQETEFQKEIEIADATDILAKVWEEYEVVDTDGNMYNDRFDLMGGHFESAVMNMPAKYDLSKTSDLERMYCVPQSAIAMIDDAATMIDLYNACRFTAVVFHVSDVETVQNLIEETQLQVSNNQWYGEKPEKLLIVEIKEQYVVSIYGEEPLVNEFKHKLVDIYKNMVNVVVEEKLQ